MPDGPEPQRPSYPAGPMGPAGPVGPPGPEPPDTLVPVQHVGPSVEQRQDANAETAARVTQLIKQVPHLANMPGTTMAIAKSANSLADPIQTAEGAVHMQHQTELNTLMAQGIAGPLAPPGVGCRGGGGLLGEIGGFFSGAGHDVAGAFDATRHGIASGYDAASHWFTGAPGGGLGSSASEQDWLPHYLSDASIIQGINHGWNYFETGNVHGLHGIISTVGGNRYGRPVVNATGQFLAEDLRVTQVPWNLLEHVLNLGGVTGAGAEGVTRFAVPWDPGLANEVYRSTAGSVNSYLDIPNHTFRYYMDVGMRHGWAAALAAAAPALAMGIVVSVATDGMLAPLIARLGLGGAAEADLLGEARVVGGRAGMEWTMRPGAADEVQGGAQGAEWTMRPATEAEQAARAAETAARQQRLEAMAERLGISGETNAERAAARRAFEEGQREFWRNFARSGLPGVDRYIGYSTERIAQTLSVPIRVARIISDLLTSPRLFAMEATNIATAKWLIYPDSWARTANGVEWSKNSPGHPPDTFGWMVYNLLPDSMQHDFIGETLRMGIDTTMNFGIPMPLGAYGRLVAEARSPEGLKGLLHPYFPGTDISKARVLFEAPGGRTWRKAVRYYATNDAGAIARANRRLATAAPEIDDLKVYKEGAATELKYAKVPKGSELPPRIASSRLAADSIDVPATEQRILDWFGDRERATTLMRVETLPLRNFSDFLKANLRAIPGRYSPGRLFANLAMYLDTTSGAAKFENKTGMIGDPNLVPAVLQVYRQLGEREGVVQHLGNMLLHTTDPAQWRMIVENAYAGFFQRKLWERAARERLSPEAGVELETSIVRAARQLAAKFTGNAFGDEAGVYVIGPDGVNLSYVDVLNKDDLSTATRSSAAVPNELERMTLPNYSQVDAAVHEMVLGWKKALEKSETIDGVRHWKIMRNDMPRVALGSARDWIDFLFNDRWFKPLALATGGWAFRVAGSEVFANMYRKGLFNTAASHFIGTSGETEYKLRQAVIERGGRLTWVPTKTGRRLARYMEKAQKGTATTAEQEAVIAQTRDYAATYFVRNDMPIPESREMWHLTAALYSFRLGLNRGLARSFAGPRFNELMDAAAASIWMEQGHISPPAVRSQHTSDITQYNRRPGAIDAAVQAMHENIGYTKSSAEVRYALSKNFQEYPNTAHGFIQARWLRALALERSDWDRALLKSWVDEYKRTGNWRQAEMAAQATGLELIDNYGEKIRYFDRAFHPAVSDRVHGTFTSTGDPRLDHAAILGKRTSGFVVGSPMAENSLWASQNAGLLDAERRYIDLIGAQRIIDRSVPGSWQAWQADVHGGVPADAFNMVSGPVTTAVKKASKEWVHGVTGWMQDHIFGPMVNNLSRDATWILDFADQRALLRGAVRDGEMTQAQADALAKIRAVQKMVQYIHNPLDKTVWDEAARVVAPFYFAQMQAWRRVGRLWQENPGAFEQYIKLMLGINRGIASLTRNGVAYLTSPYSFYGLNLLFMLNSTQSMNPIPNAEDSATGSAPWQRILAMVTPKAGPVASFPLRAIEDLSMLTGYQGFDLNIGHFGLHSLLGPDWWRGLNNKVSGQVSNQLPLVLAALPNSILQHIVELIFGAGGAEFGWGGLGGVTSSYQTVLDSVAEAAILGEMTRIYNSYANVPGTGNTAYFHPEGPGGGGITLPAHSTPGEVRLFLTYAKFSQQWDDPAWRQSFLDNMNIHTVWNWVVKMGLGAMSPFSISFGQAAPDLQTAYRGLLKKFNGDVAKADDAFHKHFPWAVVIPVSRSQTVEGGTWADTLPGVQFALTNPYMVGKYPSAAAALTPPGDRTAGYSQWSANTLGLVGLRHKDSPQQYINAMVNASGEAFVYDVLWKNFDENAARLGPNADTYPLYQEYFGTHSTGRPSYLQQFLKIAPQYASYYNSHQTEAWRETTMHEFETMALDSHYGGNSVLDNSIYVAAQLSSYFTAGTLRAYLASPNKGGYGYSTTVSWWNDKLTQIEEGKYTFPPEWGIPQDQAKAIGQRLQYTISSVFRPLAAEYTVSGQLVGG